MSMRNCLVINAVLKEYRLLVNRPAESDDPGFQVEELGVQLGWNRSIAGKMITRQYQDMAIYDRSVIGKQKEMLGLMQDIR